MSALAGPSAAPDDAPATDDDQQSEDYENQHQRRRRPRRSTIKDALVKQIKEINLARELDDETLREIGMAVVREFLIDENSRADWADAAEEAMRFAQQKTEPKQFPWPNAANVIYPLITQASIEFAARTYPALIQNRKVVKGVVWGADNGTPVLDAKGDPRFEKPAAQPPGQPPAAPTNQIPMWLVKPGEKTERAERIGEHMSYQLLEEMPEWEPQTDQLLHQIPIVGGAGRKTFRDVVANRNSSLFVSLANLVWNYNAPSFEVAPRHTEKLIYYPHQIEEFERTDADEYGEGMFLHVTYGPGDATGIAEGFGFRRLEASGGDASDPDAPHLFLEQHRRWDLDGDGYPEPYVVTVHERSSKVVRIVARYDEDGIKVDKDGEIIKIDPVDHYTLIPFLPSFDGGSYPSGWGHILRSMNDQINTSLNQMFDAGTLQNAGGGFIGDTLGLPSGQTLFQVGKYIRVNTKGGNIRDNVLPLPFLGPSQTLFQLLGFLVEAGKGVASLQNVLTGDAAIANAPPTTILALIEQGMKLYTAIHKRIYRAFKKEYAKLYRLNRIYVTAKTKYQVGDEENEIQPDDYRLGGGVVPIADPSMVTDMQKLGRAQIAMQFKDDPLVNQMEIRKRLFDAAGMDRIDDLLQPPDPAVIQQQMQMQMAKDQAELGRSRAAEQKDTTQAFLNLALARKNATAGEEAYINAQLDYLRLHIEAINTQVRAAAVDAKFHDINTGAATAHAGRLASAAEQGPAAEPAGPVVQPTPGPAGPMPVPPQAPLGPDVVGPGSLDTGTPAVPGGPGAPGQAGPPPLAR